MAKYRISVYKDKDDLNPHKSLLYLEYNGEDNNSPYEIEIEDESLVMQMFLKADKSEYELEFFEEILNGSFEKVTYLKTNKNGFFTMDDLMKIRSKMKKPKDL